MKIKVRAPQENIEDYLEPGKVYEAEHSRGEFYIISSDQCFEPAMPGPDLVIRYPGPCAHLNGHEWELVEDDSRLPRATAKELGFKPGDRFEVIEEDRAGTFSSLPVIFTLGSIVELEIDVGTDFLLFTLIEGKCGYTNSRKRDKEGNRLPGAWYSFDLLKPLETYSTHFEQLERDEG